jgi:tetratricopeptide (TPR) repeat protein
MQSNTSASMQQFVRHCAALMLTLTLCTGAFAQVELASTPAAKEVRRLLNDNAIDPAYKRAKQFVSEAPQSAEAHYWLGAVAGRLAQEASMFSALGYAKEVKAAFSKACALDPKHQEARFALMQFHLAAPGIAGGDKSQPPLIAQQLAALDPIAGHRARAMLKFHAKDQAGGISELIAGLQKSPAQPDLLGQVIGVYERDQRWPDAIKAAEAAIALAPQDAKVRYQFVKVSALTKHQTDKALLMVDELLALKPAPEGISLAGMHLRRGQILHHLGRKAEAIAAAQRALALEPKSDLIKKSLETLKKS